MFIFITGPCGLNPCVNGYCLVANTAPYYTCACFDGYSSTSNTNPNCLNCNLKVVWVFFNLIAKY